MRGMSRSRRGEEAREGEVRVGIEAIKVVWVAGLLGSTSIWR